MDLTKTCNCCGINKSLDCFYFQRRAGKGTYIVLTCKVCSGDHRQAAKYNRRSTVTVNLLRRLLPSKLCTKCDDVYTIDMFYRQPNGKYGVTSVCKRCINILYVNEDSRKRARDWYAKNHDKKLAQNNLYNARNKERKRCYERQKTATDIQYKLARNIRSRMFSAVSGGVKRGSAVKDLGCSVEFLKKRIESEWLPGMSWENWGRKGWHIDHVKPLASFDLSDREQFLKACHYTNLQPLWWRDNLIKGSKV